MANTIRFRDSSGRFCKRDGRKNLTLEFVEKNKTIASVKGKFNKSEVKKINKKKDSYIKRIKDDKVKKVFGKKINKKEFEPKKQDINFIEKYNVKKEKLFYRKSFHVNIKSKSEIFDTFFNAHEKAKKLNAVDWKITITFNVMIKTRKEIEKIQFSRSIPGFIDSNVSKNTIAQIASDFISEVVEKIIKMIAGYSSTWKIAKINAFIQMRFEK